MVYVEQTAEVERLYEAFRGLNLAPLWTQTADLMPRSPRPEARPYAWRWQALLPVAEQAGRLVPVGRGGERRAIALANPGLEGLPFATPTLWAAVQYLGPREVAPSHRHSQTAFRFVLEGEGVWTVVDGDPVAMREGDLLLTPGMAWHEHQNAGDNPMVWLDGLDIPLVRMLDAGFFEPGPDQLSNAATPSTCRSERLWGHPGLLPLTETAVTPSSPLLVYRWPDTDAALRAQLDERAGAPSALEPGHGAVRVVNPATGKDALTTIRLEIHRLAAGARTVPSCRVGSSVWQVLHGGARFELDGDVMELERGDLVAVPSWCRFSVAAEHGADLFTFSDAPFYEAIGLDRSDPAT